MDFFNIFLCYNNRGVDKIKKKFFVVLLLITILCIGCGKKTENILPNSETKEPGKLYINCKGEKSSIDFEDGEKFSCKLIKEYEFTITNVSGNKAIIVASDYGLSKIHDDGTYSLLSKEKKFELIKGEELRICTQSTDYCDELDLEWT